LLGSVFVDGFRAADLSRQSARYRSLPPFDAGQAVPHGISRQGGALHSDGNESRDWRIYADFAQVLIGIARPLYAHDQMGMDLEHSLYALDSTTIDLCLSLFPYPTRKPAATSQQAPKLLIRYFFSARIFAHRAF
jgi:hypothetical protein